MAPAKKTTGRKPASKKTAAKKPAAKKTPVRKPAARKPSARKTVAAKSTAKKASARKTPAGAATTSKVRVPDASPELFAPLCEGERADALRLLLEDARVAAMAKVGRYRVIAIEPLVLKPAHPLGMHRLARVVIFDYSSDRCVEANVDLDECAVQHLTFSKAQPMLSAEEEAAAMQIAMSDERVLDQLALGEGPQVAMHYWSHRASDLSHNRRTASVLFGEPGVRPTLIAVVDLLDAQVTEIVAAELW